MAPQAKCTVRSLNSGGTILMTVSGYVIGFAGSNMIGTATVTGNIKNKGVTNTDTELTTVMPQFDLTITKADSPDPVCAASWPGPGYPAGPGAPVGPDYPAGNTCQGGLTYTFVIGNSGHRRRDQRRGARSAAGRDDLRPRCQRTDGGGFACALQRADQRRHLHRWDRFRAIDPDAEVHRSWRRQAWARSRTP